MSLPVPAARTGVPVAAVATGILVGRCVRRPPACYPAWTVAALAMGLGSSAFRAVPPDAQSLAPLGLAWVLVALVARGEAARRCPYRLGGGKPAFTAARPCRVCAAGSIGGRAGLVRRDEGSESRE
jgi:hypothetical protein